MKAAIIDTDVVSMLFKGDSRALRYRDHIPLERNWASFRKVELTQHLSKYVVLPASRELCVKWAEISWEARRKGHPIQTADAWIAASALHYQVPLITQNVSDYDMINDLQLLTVD